MTVFAWVLTAVLLFKVGGFLMRWYEVTGAEDYVPERPGTRLARGALPFLREYAVGLWIVAVWCVEMPWRLITRRRPPTPPDPGPVSDSVPEDTPVILVHGLSVSPWSLSYMAWRLKAAGRTVHLLDYYPMFGDIEPYAVQLGALVNRVAGAGLVDVVGHSMGGLIAGRYMTGHPGRVRALVTIGTPFHGSRLWAMSISRSLPQMRPGSAFLRGLLEHPDFPGTTRLTCIYSDFDQIVLPYTSCRVDAPGVRNVTLKGLGHAALLLSPRVAAETVAALKAAPADSAPV